MSAVASLVNRIGSTVTIERPTWSINADGTEQVASYAVVATGVKVALDDVTETIRNTVFGGNPLVESRGFYTGTSVQKKDRLVVTAGARNGGKFVVEDLVDRNMGSVNRHYELGLQSTTETIA